MLLILREITDKSKLFSMYSPVFSRDQELHKPMILPLGFQQAVKRCVLYNSV